MIIEKDDLTRPEIHALLNEHLLTMYELSPPESVHALNLEALRSPDITFWSAWEGSQLLGGAALKQLNERHGEVKSMRTPTALRRRGAGRALLTFKPALNLYESFGFTYCHHLANTSRIQTVFTCHCGCSKATSH